MAHVQEVLEHAYPNGLTVELISDALRFACMRKMSPNFLRRCSEEEAMQYLLELEASGIVKREGDEWIRVDTRNVNKLARQHQAPSGQPTIAIITCLFVEKQAVDALLEDSYVIHKVTTFNFKNETFSTNPVATRTFIH